MWERRLAVPEAKPAASSRLSNLCKQKALPNYVSLRKIDKSPLSSAEIEDSLSWHLWNQTSSLFISPWRPIWLVEPSMPCAFRLNHVHDVLEPRSAYGVLHSCFYWKSTSVDFVLRILKIFETTSHCLWMSRHKLKQVCKSRRYLLVEALVAQPLPWTATETFQE